MADPVGTTLGERPAHAPAGLAVLEPTTGEREGRGWVRTCICGREFSSWSWEHVPGLFDHIATGGRS